MQGNEIGLKLDAMLQPFILEMGTTEDTFQSTPVLALIHMLKRVVTLLALETPVDLSILAEMLSGPDALDVLSASNRASTSLTEHRQSSRKHVPFIEVSSSKVSVS